MMTFDVVTGRCRKIGLYTILVQRKWTESPQQKTANQEATHPLPLRLQCNQLITLPPGAKCINSVHLNKDGTNEVHYRQGSAVSST